MRKFAMTALAAGMLAAPVVAQPNLVVTFNEVTGYVQVENTGITPAAPSVVTVRCIGACVDPNPALVAPYLDPAFPNKLAIDIPALNPGVSSGHAISFWNTLVWPAGNHSLIVCADDGNAVAETNERDNCNQQVLRIKRAPKAQQTLKPRTKRLKLSSQ